MDFPGAAEFSPPGRHSRYLGSSSPRPRALDHIGHLLRKRGALQEAAAAKSQRYRQPADGVAPTLRKGSIPRDIALSSRVQ